MEIKENTIDTRNPNWEKELDNLTEQEQKMVVNAVNSFRKD